MARARRAWWLAFPLALALLAAACGSAPASPRTAVARASASSATASSVTASATASASSTARNSPIALADNAAACMRSHGLHIPDPVTGANGQPEWNFRALAGAAQALVQAAEQACRSELVAAHVPGIGSNAAAAAAGARYSACMRQHGLPAFPDPNPATGTFTGRSSLQGNGIETGSPLFQAANTACRTQLAQGHAAIGAGG